MEKSIPWIEKYRPTSLEDMLLDIQIEKQIKVFIENKTNTHLIIMGSPGLGKTSAAKCIAKKILGEHITDGFLELNAAEERGVKGISACIPPFCKKLVNFSEPKIILLDEADNLTIKCQHDINDLIKQYGRKIKFIFTCNDSKKITEDIQSVCRICRFKPITDFQMLQYLKKICTAENIPYNKAGLQIICYISDGDMRKSINNLQLTAYAYSHITKPNVLRICKLPDPDDIKKIIILCKSDLVLAYDAMESIIADGYYYLDIVNGFTYVFETDSDMSDELKLKLINEVNKTTIIISSKVRSKLQLTAMICRLTNILLEK